MLFLLFVDMGFGFNMLTACIVFVVQVVMNFKMPGKVYRTAMSTLATSHMLVAAGTEDVQVRLCDIASGAFAHTLSGHRGMYVNANRL